MVMEEKKLAMKIFAAVGSRFVRYYETSLRHEMVGAIISNNDWGFRSQTLLSPTQLRQSVFPLHKQIVATAHAAGRSGNAKRGCMSFHSD